MNYYGAGGVVEARRLNQQKQNTHNTIIWARPNPRNAGVIRWKGEHSLYLCHAVSSGEIEGLVDGYSSVLLNGVPTVSDGQKTQLGVDIHLQTGKIWQAPAWFAPVDQRREIYNHSVTIESPFEATVVMPEADFIDVVISVPRLTAPEWIGSGDKRHEESWHWHVQPRITVAGLTEDGRENPEVHLTNGIPWIQGKWSSGVKEFVFTYFVKDIDTSGKFKIRVSRTEHKQPLDSKYADDFSVARVVGHIPRVLANPNIAAVNLLVSSNDVNQVPKCLYDVKGRKIWCPENYDPERKLWLTERSSAARSVDTTITSNRNVTNELRNFFKIPAKRWSNNPALVIRDILLDDALNLQGKFKSFELDEASFIAAAKWCDQRIFGKPRATCNLLINKPQKVFDLIGKICNEHGLSLVDNDGKLALTFDEPQPPVAVFTNANVIRGSFTYQGADATTKLRAVQVEFADAEQGYKSNQVRVEDSALTTSSFAKDEKIKAISITNREEAERLARRKLVNRKLEDKIVTFSIPADTSQLKIGDVIHIVDIPQQDVDKVSVPVLGAQRIANYYGNKAYEWINNTPLTTLGEGSRIVAAPHWVDPRSNEQKERDRDLAVTGVGDLFLSLAERIPFDRFSLCVPLFNPAYEGTFLAWWQNCSHFNAEENLVRVLWLDGWQVAKGETAVAYKAGKFKPVEYRVSAIRFDPKERVETIEATLWYRDKFKYIEQRPSLNLDQPWQRDGEVTNDTVGAALKREIQVWTPWEAVVENGVESGKLRSSFKVQSVDPSDVLTYSAIAYQGEDKADAERFSQPFKTAFIGKPEDNNYEAGLYVDGNDVIIVHSLASSLASAEQVNFEVSLNISKGGFGNTFIPLKTSTSFRKEDYQPFEMTYTSSSYDVKTGRLRLEGVKFDTRLNSRVSGKPNERFVGVKGFEVRAVMRNNTLPSFIDSHRIPSVLGFVSKADFLANNHNLEVTLDTRTIPFKWWEHTGSEARMRVQIVPIMYDGFSSLHPGMGYGSPNPVRVPTPSPNFKIACDWSNTQYGDFEVKLLELSSEFHGQIYVTLEGDNTYSNYVQRPVEVYPPLQNSGQVTYVNLNGAPQNHDGVTSRTRGFNEPRARTLTSSDLPVTLFRSSAVQGSQWALGFYDLIQKHTGETRPQGDATTYVEDGANWKVLAPPHKLKRVVVHWRHQLAERWYSVVFYAPPMRDPTAVTSETVSVADNSLAFRADFNEPDGLPYTRLQYSGSGSTRSGVSTSYRAPIPYAPSYRTKLWKASSSSGTYSLVREFEVTSDQRPVVFNDLETGYYRISNTQPSGSGGSKPRYINKPAHIKYAEVSKPRSTTVDFTSYWNEPAPQFEFSPLTPPVYVAQGSYHTSTTYTNHTQQTSSSMLTSAGYSSYTQLRDRNPSVYEYRKGGSSRDNLYWRSSYYQIGIPLIHYDSERYAPVYNGRSTASNSWDNRIVPYTPTSGNPSLRDFLRATARSKSVVNMFPLNYNGGMAAAKLLSGRSLYGRRTVKLKLNLDWHHCQVHGFLRIPAFKVSTSGFNNSTYISRLSQDPMIRLRIMNGTTELAKYEVSALSGSFVYNSKPTISNGYSLNGTNAFESDLCKSLHWLMDVAPAANASNFSNIGMVDLEVSAPDWLEWVELEGLYVNRRETIATRSMSLTMTYDSSKKAFKNSTQHRNINNVVFNSWMHSDSSVNNNKGNYVLTPQFGDEYVYAQLYNTQTKQPVTSGTLTVQASVTSVRRN